MDRSIGAANAYQLLVPFFPFFESELIQLINDVALSDFVTMHREIAGMPVTGGGVPPSFRTADPLGSSLERTGSVVRENQELFPRVS